VDARKIKVENISQVEDIPFLPIEFFKTHDVVCGNVPPQAIFRSSGTTGMIRSRHLVSDLGVYRQSFIRGFDDFMVTLQMFSSWRSLQRPNRLPIHRLSI